MLEALIAKGRRVHLPQDQREVAYGLADLSTNQDNHDRIVNKGGIRTLLHLLTSSRDVETQRFAAIALANTSSTDILRVNIANQEQSISRLIHCVRDEERDLLVRQYCVMSIGNLAAEPKNHDIIAAPIFSPTTTTGSTEESVNTTTSATTKNTDSSNVDGDNTNLASLTTSISVLIDFLKIGAMSSQDVQCGRYAAFAIANLALNSNYRKKIIDDGAAEPLIVLACSEDLDAQNQALFALGGLSIHYESRYTLVDLGILDPLVLISRLDDIESLREVSSIINCLSFVPECKAEVANRAILTIITMMVSADPVVERHASCAMANLVEVTEIQQKMIDGNGLPAAVALLSSQDISCVSEAIRIIANISSNDELNSNIAQEDTLKAIVQCLRESNHTCQKYAALALANLATNFSFQMKMVEVGAIDALYAIIRDNDASVEAQRYAALTIANLSSAKTHHEDIVDKQGLEALFFLSISPDIMSQHYVGCALANLSSNSNIHQQIVSQGGLHPLVRLLYSPEVDVHFQASLALRGLSAASGVKMKMVQAGALEPLGRLLSSDRGDLLHEACACLCNLSIADENKIEMAKCGIIGPLTTLMQSEVMEIVCHSCACLANLAELPENHLLVALDGAVKCCLSVMICSHLEARREAGRLLANLCACDSDVVADDIMINKGHHLLMSFLLSKDDMSQRIGAFGIGNLCMHEKHRVELLESSVLEPLSSLAQSNSVDDEIQKFSVIAIANLADEVRNHETFIEDQTLFLLISLFDSRDTHIKLHAAIGVANIAKNMDMRDIVTDQGGLDAVLYLARLDDDEIRRVALSALSSLSFVERNKVVICKNGGHITIMPNIWAKKRNLKASQLACCALANLSDNDSNIQFLVDSGCIPLLSQALREGDEDIRIEAARALGNLATDLTLCATVMHNDTFPSLIDMINHEVVECQRMATMALSNLACDIENNHHMLQMGVLEPIEVELYASLDSKSESDYETTRSCLTLLANLSTSKLNHDDIVERMLDILVKYTEHRDVKCRQHTIFILGNLCSNDNNFTQIEKAGVMPILTSFSFPTSMSDSTDAQLQSISGIRGISMSEEFRIKLVEGGSVEPLVLSINKNCPKNDINILREACAALCNLSLSMENKAKMVHSGVPPALVKMMRMDDKPSHLFVVAAVANLAEIGGSVHSIMLGDGCLDQLIELIEYFENTNEVEMEALRCIALFSANEECHDVLTNDRVLSHLVRSMKDSPCIKCKRFSTLAFANLAMLVRNHEKLLSTDDFLGCIHDLSQISDVMESRCVAFLLYNLSTNKQNHQACEDINMMQSLISLLCVKDMTTILHICLALKEFCTSPRGRSQFIEFSGLRGLMKILCNRDDAEARREAVAALGNISISPDNKAHIIGEDVLPTLFDLARSTDERLLHQACRVLANLSESLNLQEIMFQGGLLHQMKFVMTSASDIVMRETIRAVANISSNSTFKPLILSTGILAPLTRSLSSKDYLCRRFSAMAIANLATSIDNQKRIVEHEAALPFLWAICDSSDDISSVRFAFTAIANISFSKKWHLELIECGIIALCFRFAEYSDQDICYSAALCISNLASNICHHSDLMKAKTLNKTIPILSKSGIDWEIQLCLISMLRGLSSNVDFRGDVIEFGVTDLLLSFSTSKYHEIQVETLATFCNLSLLGCIENNAIELLENIKMSNFISFLSMTDSTHQVFGALSIANMVGDNELHKIFSTMTLKSVVDAANTVEEEESQRCLAYAICNLCAHDDQELRSRVVDEGGLYPLFSLISSIDPNDAYVGLTTIRGLASFDNLRRVIVENGALGPLFTVLSGSSPTENIREAVKAICALSLNDENKVSIVKFEALNCLIKCALSTYDDESSFLALRVLSNCSEQEHLHELIVKELDANVVMSFASRDYSKLQREFVRFYANLATNSDTANTSSILLEPETVRVILSSCKFDDVSISRDAMLVLLNLSIDERNHQHLAVCKDYIMRLLLEALTIHPNNAHHSLIDAKYFACLAMGFLLESGFVDNDDCARYSIVDSLMSTLNTSDDEKILSSSFAVNMLARKMKSVSQVKSSGIETYALKLISHEQDHSSEHLISALRNLTLEGTVKMNVVKNDRFNALSQMEKHASIEIKRDIAATLCQVTLDAESRFYTVKQSSVMDTILDLCFSSDDETARFALGALANIAEDESHHNMILQHDRIIRHLSKMIICPELGTKREAARTILNLLTTISTHASFIEQNGLDSLQLLSEASNDECYYLIALSIQKVSSIVSNHDAIVKSGLVHFLFRILRQQSHFYETKEATIAALRNISSNSQVRSLVMKGGIIESLGPILEGSDYVLCSIAAGILRYLSISQCYRQQLWESGIVGLLSESVMHSDSEVLALDCARAISNIAEDNRLREPMWKESSLILALIKMVKSSHLPTHGAVVRALCFLSVAKVSILESMERAVIEAIIRLLQSKSTSISKDATIALQNLATSNERKILMLELGALHPLMSMLSSDCTDCQWLSCKALAKLLESKENRYLFSSQNSMFHDLVRLCSSDCDTVTRYTVAVLCNLSACEQVQSGIIDAGGVEGLLTLLSSKCIHTSRQSSKAICNLTNSKKCLERLQIATGIPKILALLQHEDLKCNEYGVMALCNIACGRILDEMIVKSGVPGAFVKTMCNNETITLKRAVALAIYNMASSETCHHSLIENAIEFIVMLCKDNDVPCRCYSMMSLCNFAANSNVKKDLIRKWALKSAICMLMDSDMHCNIYACIFLSNMTTDQGSQTQVVLQGGLSPLISHLSHENITLKRCAMMCIANLATNPSNHKLILRERTLESLCSLPVCGVEYMEDLRSLAVGNLATKSLDYVAKEGGISKLTILSQSENDYFQCFALGSLRRFAAYERFREDLFLLGIMEILSRSYSSREVCREISACLCNLSQSTKYRTRINDLCLPVILSFLRQKDDTGSLLLHACRTVANLAEEEKCHQRMQVDGVNEVLIDLVESEQIEIRIEISRAICNLFSSVVHCCGGDYSRLIPLLCLTSAQHENVSIQFYSALLCRKLTLCLDAHHLIMSKGLEDLFTLLQSSYDATKWLALAALRNLSVNPINATHFSESHNDLKGIAQLLEESNAGIQAMALATFRHLSCVFELKKAIVCSIGDDFVKKFARSGSGGVLYEVACLLANITENTETHTVLIDQGIIPALISIAGEQIENDDILKSIFRTIANLSMNCRNKITVYNQNGYEYLMGQYQNKNIQVQHYVSLALQHLTCNSDVQSSLVEEERTIEQTSALMISESIVIVQAATFILSLLSNDKRFMKRLMKENNFLSQVLDLSCHEDLGIQRNAVCIIANIATETTYRATISDQDAISVFKSIASKNTDTIISREIVRFFSLISTDEKGRELIIKSGVFSCITRYTKRHEIETQRYAILSICNLTLSKKRRMICEDDLFKSLRYLCRFPDTEIQRLASLSVASLLFHLDIDQKVDFSNIDILKPILEIVRYPDIELQQCASIALNSFLIGGDDKLKLKLREVNGGLPTIMSLIDSCDLECVHNGLYAIGSLIECHAFQKDVLQMECVAKIEKKMLESFCTIEIKRAAGYILAIFSECIHHHEKLQSTEGTFKQIIHLVGLIDIECQVYGTFALALLANNHKLKVPLVRQFGAVRPLVSILARKDNSRHYAGLALLRLAEDFTNHLTIAEEGGIQALLKLSQGRKGKGRNVSVDNEEMSYKAAKTTAHLASKAVENLPRRNELQLRSGKHY